MADATGPKKFYLSQTDKKIAGLCGGIAAYFGLDSTLVRLAFVLITVVTAVFPMLLFYIVAVLVSPRGPEA